MCIFTFWDWGIAKFGTLYDLGWLSGLVGLGHMEFSSWRLLAPFRGAEALTDNF